MGNDSVNVVAQELGTHAGHLDDLEQRLGTAASAARTVSMDNDAYGILGRPFAWLLDPFESLGTDMISQAEATITSHAEAMRGSQQTYEGTEGTNNALFNGGQG